MAKINDDGFLELSGVNNAMFKDVLNAEKFSILSALSPLSLRVLNQASHVLQVAQGVEMMHAGDTPHDLYFISKGLVSIGKRTDGKMKLVATLAAGSFYGEYGALRGKIRFASVYTAEPSEIIRVDLNAIRQVFDADVAFRNRVYQEMQERLLNSFLFSHQSFKKIPSNARAILAKDLEIVELERDEMLFREGDIADKYYIILSGEVEVTMNLNHVQTVIEVRRENSFLGEVRANKGVTYAYGAYAANSLDLIVLDKKSMQSIQKVYPEALSLLNQMLNHSAKKMTLLMKNIMQR
ncbi:MAG: cyclic nucleotide-binding domain-containing protein [Ghiorsea sp.]|nr:cyclic nucleotide-binding domain-containing protein [Ghiorsea sp.]